jgi:hypothetical protein
VQTTWQIGTSVEQRLGRLQKMNILPCSIAMATPEIFAVTGMISVIFPTTITIAKEPQAGQIFPLSRASLSGVQRP